MSVTSSASAATTATTATTTVKYGPGDVVRINGYAPITITQIISSSYPIGYAGTYVTTYQGEKIAMDMGWLPQGLIIEHLSSPKW
jgi:hypothetical protein